MIGIESHHFTPTPIQLQDDAVHPPKMFGNVETWYYDAILSNSYSMACVVNVMRFLNTGLVLSGVFLYKDTILLKWVRTRTLLTHFQGSHERPQLILHGKIIIDAKPSQNPKEWTYHVSLGDEKNNIELDFLKNREGWRGTHVIGDWLVAPRLTVTGTLTMEGTTVNVTGIGYHDHNNYPLFSPFFAKEANFGKIIAGPITAVWGQVIRKNNQADNMLVINTDGTLQSLASNDIQLRVKEFIEDRGKRVTKKYGLHVLTQGVSIDVDIESLNYHYLTIPGVKYWRHHARNIGTITVGSHSEKVEDLGIIDQLTFL